MAMIQLQIDMLNTHTQCSSNDFEVECFQNYFFFFLPCIFKKSLYHFAIDVLIFIQIEREHEPDHATMLLLIVLNLIAAFKNVSGSSVFPVSKSVDNVETDLMTVFVMDFVYLRSGL